MVNILNLALVLTAIYLLIGVICAIIIDIGSFLIEQDGGATDEELEMFGISREDFEYEHEKAINNKPLHDLEVILMWPWFI